MECRFVEPYSSLISLSIAFSFIENVCCFVCYRAVLWFESERTNERTNERARASKRVYFVLMLDWSGALATFTFTIAFAIRIRTAASNSNSFVCALLHSYVFQHIHLLCSFFLVCISLSHSLRDQSVWMRLTVCAHIVIPPMRKRWIMNPLSS